MDSKKIEAQDKILTVIKERKNFVLQGGAGSGKTETLKRVIHSISKEYNTKKIACITYTNLAADEIKERVGDEYTICTIHSFLNDSIKNYKKNMHQVIEKLFILPKVERKDISFYLDEKEFNKEEHDNYKKVHEKYSKNLWYLYKKSMDKVIGKRDYDKAPEVYNTDLNALIDILNIEIVNKIKEKSFNDIKYNETKFNNLEKLSFGHDGLLEIGVLLFKKFPTLIQIIQDKYDYIFIDEYQDTRPDIIDVFIKNIGNIPSKTIIGLFGDSMQGIYKDGIGDVDNYIEKKLLQKINKEDNYRSSKQVINFVNDYRNDGMIQKLALKDVDTIGSRKGKVKLYYSVCKTEKPIGKLTSDEREKYKSDYLSELLILIESVEKKEKESYRKLMLTNKAISSNLNFKNLYDIFTSITQEVNEKIDKDFSSLQLTDLVELCEDFKNKKYNLVLTKVKKAGFKLNKIEDKDKISELLKEIIEGNINCLDALEIAFSNKLIKKSSSYENYISYKNKILKELDDNKEYQVFKELLLNGLTTFTKISKEIPSIEEDIFKDLTKKYNKEQFYIDIFDNKKILFSEIINYKKYIDNETDYITMHKTKGSGIDNVLVVLEEFFWNEYDFSCIFDDNEQNLEKKLKNQKLFYVACTRAINNLICVKLIQEDEETKLIKAFPESEKF